MNPKYQQKKRNYSNSGVVVLADLKVRPSPPWTSGSARGLGALKGYEVEGEG